QRMHLRIESHDLFGVAAGHVSCHINAIACTRAMYSRSRTDHCPRRVCSRSVWKLRLNSVGAGALVCLKWIHADGMNLYENLSSTRLQIGNALDLQHLRSAELLNANRLHQISAYFFEAERR